MKKKARENDWVIDSILAVGCFGLAFYVYLN